MSDSDFSSLTRDEAKALMDQMAKEGRVGIMHPSLVRRLLELGLDVKVKDGETVGEFFDRARAHADQVIAYLPPMPNWLEYQFQRPYFEARCNLLFGLYGASITLCSILLERVLKWTAFCVDTQTFEGDLTARWIEMEEKMDFSSAINFAKAKQLVDKDFGKRLHRFRDEVRNVQVHMKVHASMKDAEFHESGVIDFKAKTLSEGQVLRAIEIPAATAIAKEKWDEASALPIFLFMHQAVEHLFYKMAELTQTPLEEPSKVAGTE